MDSLREYLWIQNKVFVPLHFTILLILCLFSPSFYLIPDPTGPFSCTGGSTAQAFVVSSNARLNGEADWPDTNIQTSHSAQPFYEPSLLGENTNPKELTIMPYVTVSRPKSRGYIQLNPRDHFGSPVIMLTFFRIQQTLRRFSIVNFF